MSISVLIATMNRLQDLYKCLEAIRGQTGDLQIEVCVVNDGGASVQSVVERFPDMRIKFRDLPRNVGQAAARNLALRMASCEYIAICDDDDRWLPQHLLTLHSTLTSSARKFGFAYTDTELVWLGRQGDSVVVSARKPFAWHTAEAMLRSYNPIAPSSVLYSRAIHDIVGGFDEDMGHYWDWDFWLSAASVSEISRIPSCQTLYAIDARGSNQSSAPAAMRRHLERLIAKHNMAQLPSSNFALMLEEPTLQSMQAPTQVVWDGFDDIW